MIICKCVFPVFKLILLTFAVFSCTSNEMEIPPKNFEEIVVVANRSAGSISFLNANTDQVLKTLQIAGSMPMYVVYVAAKDRIYVGDRAGKKVHVLNPSSRAIETSILVGTGVFHMWADAKGNQLWVTDDIDNTISVIDLNTNTVIKTIALSFAPHDVFLTKDGSAAFVSSFVSDFSVPDKVYKFSTTTFAQTEEITVGKDPHLFHLPDSNKLVVTCLDDKIFTLNGNDLSMISTKTFAGAHGIFPSPDFQTLFVANLTGNQLYSINTNSTNLNGPPISSLKPTPHNIVLNEAGNKMFVTHSGFLANTVSTYTITDTAILPGTTIITGANPFGLTYYKIAIN